MTIDQQADQTQEPEPAETKPDQTQEPAAKPEPKGWRERREAFLAAQGAGDAQEGGDSPEGQDKAKEGQDDGEGKGEGKAKEEAKTEDKFSKRFASLVAKETRIAQREQQLKADRVALESAQAELTSVKSLIAQDPIKGLARLGFTMSDLTKRVLQGQAGPDPADLVKESEERIRQEMTAKEQERKASEEAQQAALMQQRRLAEFASSVSEELKTGDYPLTRLEKSEAVYNECMRQMLAEHAATGTILAYSDVLTKIEAKLREDFTKRQAALGHTAQQSETRQAAAQTRTMTNRQAQERGPEKPLSWQERRKRFVEGQ